MPGNCCLPHLSPFSVERQAYRIELSIDTDIFPRCRFQAADSLSCSSNPARAAKVPAVNAGSFCPFLIRACERMALLRSPERGGTTLVTNRVRICRLRPMADKCGTPPVECLLFSWRTALSKSARTVVSRTFRTNAEAFLHRRIASVNAVLWPYRAKMAPHTRIARLQNWRVQSEHSATLPQLGAGLTRNRPCQLWQFAAGTTLRDHPRGIR